MYLSWTHATEGRRREAEGFARAAGVPPERLFFHGATDGSVCDEIGSLLPRFDRMMFAAKPDVVACGAFEQGHLDHDATNFLVNRTHGRRGGTVAEIPFYHAYTSRVQRFNRFSGVGGEVERRDLDAEDRRFKTAVARGYPSQNIYALILWHEAARLATGRRPDLRGRELLRVQTHREWRAPNHPARLRARVERCARWGRWLAAMERLSVP